MVALSDFWLLHGFAADIPHRLNEYTFLQEFLPIFQSGGIKALFEYLLNLPIERSNQILSDLAEQIIPLYQQGTFNKESPDFWAARAMLNLCTEGNYDKGIFSIYLMNILHLQPGEGIFQGAGLLHAYLEGQNVELMSNSDNVLRAGLTPKHIDIKELMDNTDFVSTNPLIIQNSLNKTVHNYPCSTADFSIQKVSLEPGEQWNMCYDGPSILLQLKGEVECEGYSHYSTKGLAAFFIDASEPIACNAKASTDIFIATVPV
jgi:mannose-6-phosphate isomerase